MLEWVPHVPLEALRALVPEDDGDRVDGNQDHADQLCRGIHDLLKGNVVDLAAMERLEAGENLSSQAAIPASQVVGPPRVPDAAASSSRRPSALTQGEQASLEDADPDQKRRRLREEPPLSAADFGTDRDLKKRILKSALKSTQQLYSESKNSQSFKTSGNPVQLNAAFRTVFQFLCQSTLAQAGERRQHVYLLKPPQNHQEEVLVALQTTLNLSVAEYQRTRATMLNRPENDTFDMEAFNACIQTLNLAFAGGGAPADEQ